MSTAAQNQPAGTSKYTNDVKNHRENAAYWQTRYVGQMDANAKLNDRISELEGDQDEKREILADKIELLEQQLANKERVLKARNATIESLREKLQETRLQLNNCDANAWMHRTVADIAPIGLVDGKDLISGDDLSNTKHVVAEFFCSKAHKRRIPSRAPEAGSPAAADGCTEYRMPKK